MEVTEDQRKQLAALAAERAVTLETGRKVIRDELERMRATLEQNRQQQELVWLSIREANPEVPATKFMRVNLETGEVEVSRSRDEEDDDSTSVAYSSDPLTPLEETDSSVMEQQLTPNPEVATLGVSEENYAAHLERLKQQHLSSPTS